MTAFDPVPGEPNPKLPLIFVHIPRTGGMTLNFMLQRAFGHERTLLAAHWYRKEHEDLKRFAFVEGHHGIQFFLWKFGAGWLSNAITMLRNPVARTVSQARHIRALPGPYQDYLRTSVRNPVEVFERIPRLVNLQTKQLSSTPLDAAHVETRALDEAKTTLDQLAFGLTDAFDSSVSLFMERLRIGVPKLEVANRSHGKHDDDLLSDDFRAAAREHNDLDEQLYDYAETLWRSRLASFTTSLLALPADDVSLTCGLQFQLQQVESSIRLPFEPVSAARFSGWVLVDGRAADAALLRIGAEVIPLIPRIERSDAGRQTEDLHNRNAGVQATITIPADARSIELIAFDRSRNRRAVREIDITRVEPDERRTKIRARAKKRSKGQFGSA
jgi:hypothetical protein